jgi:hypothetical protein
MELYSKPYLEILPGTSPPGPHDIVINLDPSALKKDYCHQALTYKVIDGLVSKTRKAQPLILGSAVHKFAELNSKCVPYCLVNNGTTDMQVDLATYCGMLYQMKGGDDSAKLVTLMAGRPDDLPKPLCANPRFVEMVVTIPYRLFKHEGKSVLVNLVANMDLLYLRNGYIHALDYKTSSSYDVNRTIHEYSKSVQFIFYYWLLRKFPQWIFDGYQELINLADSGRVLTEVCLIRSGSQGCGEWMRRDDWRWQFNSEMPLLEEQLDLIIEDLAEIAFGIKPASMQGMLHDSCGSCQYNSICWSNDENLTATLLTKNYEQTHYDPSQWYKD